MLTDWLAARGLAHRPGCLGPRIEQFDARRPGPIERHVSQWRGQVLTEQYERGAPSTARVTRCGGCGAQVVKDG